MGTLKFVNLDYKQQDLIQETIVLLGLCLLESVRIHLGKKGSLSDHGEFSIKLAVQSTQRFLFRVSSVAFSRSLHPRFNGRHLPPLPADPRSKARIYPVCLNAFAPNDWACFCHFVLIQPLQAADLRLVNLITSPDQLSSRCHQCACRKQPKSNTQKIGYQNTSILYFEFGNILCVGIHVGPCEAPIKSNVVFTKTTQSNVTICTVFYLVVCFVWKFFLPLP